MKKIACQYAIVRFVPYVETGEFANVGIVLLAPKPGYFDFPFVELRDDRAIKVIKPLHLAQDGPNKILDHGGAWLFKIQQLKKRNKLPNKVLFAVEGPTAAGRRQQACQDIEGELRETGAYVVPYTRKEKVVKFALDQKL